MKNWSIGKIMAVTFAGITAIIVLGLIGVSLFTKSHNHAQSTTFTPITPVPSPSPALPQQTAAATPIAAPPAPAQSARADIVETQLEDAARDKNKTLESVTALQQQMQQGNAAVAQNLSAIQTQVQALSARLDSLEHPSNGGVEIVKPTVPPRVSETKKLAKTAKSVPASSGYKFEAAVSNRAWVKVGDHDETVTVGDPLPSASQPMRVQAMSAESGLFVVPTKQD